jgi:hypothetical protein
MADDIYGYDDGDEPKGRDNLFLWTVFILLLIGVAFACWLGSFYIFGHPERPGSYRFLKKLGKIEAPRRFEVTAAPQGEFLTAQKLFDRYGRMTRLEIEEENAQLLRSYIKNYRETKKLITYVTGRFLILDAYDLQKTDIFPTGVVALAQAAEFPQVVIEHVYSSSPRYVPALRSLLKTGLEMKIEKTNDLSALIHIERMPDGHMQFTVVPLLYGTYALKKGVGTFSLEPPTELNMDPGLPVIKRQGFEAGLKKFADYRRTHPLASTDPTAENSTAPATPELVRVDTVKPGSIVQPTGTLPAMPVATPMPIAGSSTPRIAAATPPIAVAMLNTPAPVVPRGTPMPPAATPPPKVSPTGVPLQPFIEAKRDPNMPSTGGSWRIYPVGKAPPARTVTPVEAGELADRGELGDRIYLRGDFRVTASTDNRAVLRDRAGGTEPAASTGARIIVEYPAGAIPPAENSVFVRDSTRPFEIRDVRRGADGQVNIYVREIIQQ